MVEVLNAELQRQYRVWMSSQGNEAALWLLPSWIDVGALAEAASGGRDV